MLAGASLRGMLSSGGAVPDRLSSAELRRLSGAGLWWISDAALQPCCGMWLRGARERIRSSDIIYKIRERE
jgi:hypothetical protein